MVADQGKPPFRQHDGMENILCLRQAHQANVCFQKYPRSEPVSENGPHDHKELNLP